MIHKASIKQFVRSRKCTAALLAISLLSPAALAQSPPPAAPPTQPAATAPQAQIQDLTRYSKMVEALASDEFRARDAAQKQLDAMGWQEKEIIEQLAAQATDPEAKARLLGRVEAIEDQLAVDPPPISIDVKDATLGQVATALAKATGKPILGNGGLLGPRYTLKASEKSFIEILKELNAQHPLFVGRSINGGAIGLNLLPGRAGGEMAFTPGAVAFSMQPAIQVGNMPPQLWIIYSLAMDPRIEFAQLTDTRFTQAVDDKGNAIALTGEDSNGAGNGSAVTQIAHIPVTPNLGTKLVRARGETTVTVIVREQRLEVVNPAKHLHEPFTLGKGATVELQQFELTDKRFEYQLRRSPTSDEVAAAASAGKVDSAAELVITATVVDAAGRTMTLNGTGGSVNGNVVLKEPLKLVLSVPTRTKVIKVPFELKNVPLK